MAGIIRGLSPDPPYGLSVPDPEASGSTSQRPFRLSGSSSPGRTVGRPHGVQGTAGHSPAVRSPRHRAAAPEFFDPSYH